MTIAELFVKIGVVGDGGAKKALVGVDAGLKDIASSSVAAKAGILAIFYGLERLTGMASQMGMNLKKFADVTGLSTQELQKWQYIGQTYDVTADEMAQTVRGLQSTITDMMLGKGMPEGAAALGIKMTRDPFNLLQQLSKAAKALPPDVAGTLIKSFGVSDGVFQMLRSSNLELDKLSKADMLSDREIEKLTKINKVWKDIWFSLKMMGTKMVAKDGLFPVQTLRDALKTVRESVNGVVKLIEKFQELKVLVVAIGVALGIAFAPISTLVAGLVLLLADYQKFKKGEDSFLGDTVGGNSAKKLEETGGISGIGDRLKNHKMDILKASLGDTFGAVGKIGGWMGIGNGNAVPPQNQLAAEQRSKAGQAPSSTAAKGTAPAINVHNYGVEHPKETGDSTKKGISDAFRQLSAQAGGV